MGPGTHPPIGRRKSGRAMLRAVSSAVLSAPSTARLCPEDEHPGSALPGKACVPCHGCMPVLATHAPHRSLPSARCAASESSSGKVAPRQTSGGKRAGGSGRTERGFSFRSWGLCWVGLAQAELGVLETGAAGQGVARAPGSVLGPRPSWVWARPARGRSRGLPGLPCSTWLAQEQRGPGISGGGLTSWAWRPAQVQEHDTVPGSLWGWQGVSALRAEISHVVTHRPATQHVGTPVGTDCPKSSDSTHTCSVPASVACRPRWPAQAPCSGSRRW